MKKIIIGIIALVVIILGVWKYQTHPEKPTSDKPVIKIGISLPLTGNFAAHGTTLQKALELSLADSEKNNPKYKYELIFEDDGYDLKKSLINLNRFKSINNVNAVMSFWGNIGTITSEWTEKNKIVHMACAASNKVGEGYYNFNHATQPQTLLNRMLKYYRDNNFKRIGITYLQALEIQEFVDHFVPTLKENGFEVVFITPFNPQERDMKIEILKMKEAKPDVVNVFLQSPTLNIFGKTAKELEFNVPMINVNNMTAEYEGQAIITEDSGKSEFTKHFEETTGMKQKPCVVNLYDGLQMLINGYEKTPVRNGNIVPDNEDVVKTMLDIQNNGFKSVLEEINMDNEGNIDSPAILKRMINGQLVSEDK